MRVLQAALLVSLFMLPSASQAEDTDRTLNGWGEVHFRDSSEAGVQGDEEYKLKAFLTQARDERWGWFAFTEAKQTYAQAYAGPTYSPKKWLQVGLGIGLEQDQNPLRVGGFLWAGHGRYSLLTIQEHGGSGRWYRTEANFQALERLGLGAMHQKGYGLGPRIQFQIPRSPIVLWAAALRDNDAQTGKRSVHGGLRIKF
jgi:hypothetical protein